MTRAAPESIAVARDWRPNRAAIEAIVAGWHSDPFVVFGEMDVHLMADGTRRRLYEKLGAAPWARKGPGDQYRRSNI